MEQLAGVNIEKNARGREVITYIDLSKYGEMLVPFFKKIIVKKEDKPYNPEFVAKIRRSEKQESVALDLDNLWK
ncbi:MAG: hypothetical protein LBN93_02125 [Candidatus Symbiothrix sp.]|nr:hypothetical protein [Candidatus Symbiothrix sp.]